MTDAVNQPLADGTLWKDTFSPAVSSFIVDSREGTTTPGAYWGVPFELVLMAMQYNQAHFETAGITTPPATWAEFLAACEALSAKGIKPICVSGPTAPYCAQWWDRLTQRIVGKQAVLDVAFGEAKVADNPGFLSPRRSWPSSGPMTGSWKASTAPTSRPRRRSSSRAKRP